MQIYLGVCPPPWTTFASFDEGKFWQAIMLPLRDTLATFGDRSVKSVIVYAWCEEVLKDFGRDLDECPMHDYTPTFLAVPKFRPSFSMHVDAHILLDRSGDFPYGEAESYARNQGATGLIMWFPELGALTWSELARHVEYHRHNPKKVTTLGIDLCEVVDA